jgi:hypothetical protein
MLPKRLKSLSQNKENFVPKKEKFLGVYSQPAQAGFAFMIVFFVFIDFSPPI